MLWLRAQKRGIIGPAQAEALDATFPFWRDRHVAKTWYERLHEAAEIVDALGEIPSGSHSNPRYRSAYLWLRKNKRLPAEDPRRRLLTNRIPEWELSAEAIWERRLGLVQDHLHSTGELPPGNTSLGRWLTKQPSAPMVIHMIRLDKDLPGWREWQSA